MRWSSELLAAHTQMGCEDEEGAVPKGEVVALLVLVDMASLGRCVLRTPFGAS